MFVLLRMGQHRSPISILYVWQWRPHCLLLPAPILLVNLFNPFNSWFFSSFQAYALSQCAVFHKGFGRGSPAFLAFKVSFCTHSSLDFNPPLCFPISFFWLEFLNYIIDELGERSLSVLNQLISTPLHCRDYYPDLDWSFTYWPHCLSFLCFLDGMIRRYL